MLFVTRGSIKVAATKSRETRRRVALRLPRELSNASPPRAVSHGEKHRGKENSRLTPAPPSAGLLPAESRPDDDVLQVRPSFQPTIERGDRERASRVAADRRGQTRPAGRKVFIPRVHGEAISILRSDCVSPPAFSRCPPMGCASSSSTLSPRLCKRTPGYEDPAVLAAETSCGHAFLLLLRTIQVLPCLPASGTKLRK
jgi:hypothetical protein